MLRNIGAVIIGVLVGALVVYLVERAGHMMFPTAGGVDLKDPAAVKGMMAAVPLGAKIAVVVAWFLGVFAGGSSAALIGRRWAPAAWVAAGTLSAMIGITLVQIPHPWWMTIGAVLAMLGGAWGAVKATGAAYGRPSVKPDPMPGL